jgi:hypothetical protein
MYYLSSYLQTVSGGKKQIYHTWSHPYFNFDVMFMRKLNMIIFPLNALEIVSLIVHN